MGLAGRFIYLVVAEARGDFNEGKIGVPWPSLIEALANLVSFCLTAHSTGQRYEVGLDPEARNYSRQIRQEIDRRIDDCDNEIVRNLLGRVNLNILKVAAVRAVGNIATVSIKAEIDRGNMPTITVADLTWARGLVTGGVDALVSRYASGDMGEIGGNQVKQQDEVIRVIREYVTRAWPQCSKYHGDEAFHKHGVITFAHIQQRLQATSAFRNDRLGPREAMNRAIKFMLESDVLREIPTKQMIDTYGKHPRSFAVSDPKVILNGLQR
jgi:hypothetical protein